MENNQKFKRGYRVKILSRLSDGLDVVGRWENNGVGQEAIVQFSNNDKPNDITFRAGYEDQHGYSLYVLFKHGARTIAWFEEKYLELICCNEAKGEKILKEMPPP